MYNIFSATLKQVNYKIQQPQKTIQTVLWNENKHQSIKQHKYKCQGFFFCLFAFFYSKPLTVPGHFSV